MIVDWERERHRYRVTRIQRGIDPLELPARLLERDGEHRLALVTCGGWDGTTWTSRIVTWAAPMG